ncbi:hypothetical protein, partial [Vibrio anguillarum]|uniref:hypothetical protein n=1 Tax=Vibrio anguillarum TaxID=55601 RepID=UPI00188D346D
LINAHSKPIQQILDLAKDYGDAEGGFFQRSCAWIENDEVVQYRLLIDHFNDAPESSYFDINDNLVSRVIKNISINSIEEILSKEMVLEFGGNKLSVNKSSISNSALLNLIIHINEGKIFTTEEV